MTILCLLTLSSFAWAQSQVEKDVQYGKAGDTSLKLDISVPDGSGPFPVAIVVHGGGWGRGDKEGKGDIEPVFGPLTDARFVWFSIDYRLAPKYQWPACLSDVRTAIRWVKAHAAQYKGDPGKIALIGYSAGGHLVCQAATVAGPDTQVQAVVGLAAPTDLVLDTQRRGGLSKSLQALLDRQNVDDQTQAILADISPINHVHTGLPPFLLVQGTADKTVPFVQSVNFQKKLQDAGVTCTLIPIDGATHTIADWSKLDPGYGSKMTAWLVSTLSQPSSQTATGAKKLGTGNSDGPREVTVAADGSGDFKSVQDAINAVPTGTLKQPSIIHVKPGVYNERLYVQREKRFVHLVGEDPATTVVVYDLYANVSGPDGKPIGTFRTPTAQVDADDFTAEGITFQNSAGPKGQALALRVDGDRDVFKNCRFLGWQDTILDNRGRHYYDHCFIAGATDFIFGGGTALFDNCAIECDGNGYITAASTPEDQAYGFVFSNCHITGKTADVQTYLGRPWRGYASVIFLNTDMGGVVRPEGWKNWNNTDRDKTARYAEFHNTGPGSATKDRVSWSKQLSASQASEISLGSVLGGTDEWNPIDGTTGKSQANNLLSQER
ncbi:MAG TPA: pectinesterase family protein [Capsulimonadaceae bacterium]|nr:pectinesterase family protein [Capsulimonadaceae bacterium]